MSIISPFRTSTLPLRFLRTRLQASDLLATPPSRAASSSTASGPVTRKKLVRTFRTMPSPPNWEMTDSVRENPILASTMEAMRRIAPLQLADTSFDNVGLLLQAPTPRTNDGEKQGVMLAIDLTTDVCNEILSSPENIKVAIVYHPIIFRGLKSLTFADPQQASLLRLAAAGVSVYCPHTSLDAVPGGINDWLGKVVNEEAFMELSSDQELRDLINNPYPYLSNTKNAPKGYEAAGMGRFIKLEVPRSFENVVERVKQNLALDHVQGYKSSDELIRTVAVCAGSGSSVFSGIKADLYLTGELSHHEVLAYKAAGASVIITNHTNTERKYLRDVLQHWLRRELPSQYSVSVSETDCDPLTVL